VLGVGLMIGAGLVDYLPRRGCGAALHRLHARQGRCGALPAPRAREL